MKNPPKPTFTPYQGMVELMGPLQKPKLEQKQGELEDEEVKEEIVEPETGE